MIVASLFALVLAQAEAPLVSSNQDASPVATSAAPAAADIPKGAPADDFGLVAWCRGALTGHMALYQLVKPELHSIERPGEVATEEKDDQAQMQAGRDYLALYHRAMLVAEKDSSAPLRARGATLEAQGEAIWSGARAAEPRARMWTWLMWDLPGRCEVAAKRLVAHRGLTATTAVAQPSPEPAGSAEPPAGSAISTAEPAALPEGSDPAPASTSTPPSPAGPQ